MKLVVFTIQIKTTRINYIQSTQRHWSAYSLLYLYTKYSHYQEFNSNLSGRNGAFTSINVLVQTGRMSLKYKYRAQLQTWMQCEN